MGIYEEPGLTQTMFALQMAQGRRNRRLAQGLSPEPEDPKSRIKIFVGRSGGMGRAMRRTTVELPFTEITPTMTSSGGQAVSECQRVLERLRPAERDVVLANLLAKFGHVVPG